MDYSPGYYISAIYRHLQICLNSQFENLGFGSGQYLFFNAIAGAEGITQKELSIKLAIDKATTAKAVKKLTELGYIRAVNSKGDKRYYNLFLTDSGRTILPQVRSILVETRSMLQKGLNEQEVELSFKIMNIMLVNVTEEVKPQAMNND